MFKRHDSVSSVLLDVFSQLLDAEHLFNLPLLSFPLQVRSSLLLSVDFCPTFRMLCICSSSELVLLYNYIIILRCCTEEINQRRVSLPLSQGRAVGWVVCVGAIAPSLSAQLIFLLLAPNLHPFLVGHLNVSPIFSCSPGKFVPLGTEKQTHIFFLWMSGLPKLFAPL